MVPLGGGGPLCKELGGRGIRVNLIAPGVINTDEPVAEVVHDLGISAESIYTWRRQDRIDRGLVPGLSSAEKAELVAAKKRIAELEAEVAVHRRASELLGAVVPPQDGSRPSP